jgi:hypothetical protein
MAEAARERASLSESDGLFERMYLARSSMRASVVPVGKGADACCSGLFMQPLDPSRPVTLIKNVALLGLIKFLPNVTDEPRSWLARLVRQHEA